MQPVRIRDLVYWTLFYFLPAVITYFYCTATAYKLSNFTYFFFAYVLIYLLSLVFIGKIVRISQFTFLKLLLTVFVIFVLDIIVSIAGSFFSPFGTVFILQGSYQQPPNNWFFFEGGYGACPDLTDCTYITKVELVLYLIAIQIVSYILAIFVGRLFLKIKSNRWQHIRMNIRKLFLAFMLAIYPVIIDYFIAIKTHNMSQFEYIYSLDDGLLSGIISFLQITLVPFIFFYLCLLADTTIIHRLGFFISKGNQKPPSLSKKILFMLLFVFISLAFIAGCFYFDYNLTVNFNNS
jgi:hypothetical protein